MRFFLSRKREREKKEGASPGGELYAAAFSRFGAKRE
jgi:hypothetical protein